MIINDIEKLHPYLQEKIKKLLKQAKEAGLDVAIFETLRNIERQKELIKQGFSQTLQSKHLEGMACDIVFLEKGKPSWDSKYNWKLLGTIGKSLGLRWGGEFKNFFDGPHFEVNENLEEFKNYGKINEFQKYRDWSMNLKLYSLNDNWEKPLSKDEFTKVLNTFVKIYGLDPK